MSRPGRRDCPKPEQDRNKLGACGVLSPELNGEGETMLLRIVSMLTKLARRGHELREEPARYEMHDYDYDDSDNGEDREPHHTLHTDRVRLPPHQASELRVG